MKKLAVILAAVMTLTCLAGCSGAPANPGNSSGGTGSPKVTWRAQSVETAGTERQSCVENFAKLVSEATGGNFTIEVYSAGSLYTQEDLVEALGNGVTECAFTSNDYHSGIEPMLKLASYRTSDVWNDKTLDEAFFEKYEPLVAQAYEKMGLVYVGTVLDQPGECFMSNKKIENLSQFKGVLVRSGGLGQELYAALGASVVTMPMGDVYSAAKLGTIDAFEVGGYIDNYQNALHEVAKYLIEPTPHSTSGVMIGNLIVNPDAWNALPDEYKEVLKTCAAENRSYTFDRLTEMNVGARQDMIDAGLEVVTLSDEDFATIKETAAVTLKGYWGSSELTDQFLTLYVEFLSENGYPDISSQIQK